MSKIREKAVSIVKIFYKGSLGDIDLTLMIESALVQVHNEAIEKAANILELKCNAIHQHVICDESARDEIRQLKIKEGE